MNYSIFEISIYAEQFRTQNNVDEEVSIVAAWADKYDIKAILDVHDFCHYLLGVGTSRNEETIVHLFRLSWMDYDASNVDSQFGRVLSTVFVENKALGDWRPTDLEAYLAKQLRDISRLIDSRRPQRTTSDFDQASDEYLHAVADHMATDTTKGLLSDDDAISFLAYDPALNKYVSDVKFDLDVKSYKTSRTHSVVIGAKLDLQHSSYHSFIEDVWTEIASVRPLCDRGVIVSTYSKIAHQKGLDASLVAGTISDLLDLKVDYETPVMSLTPHAFNELYTYEFDDASSLYIVNMTTETEYLITTVHRQ